MKNEGGISFQAHVPPVINLLRCALSSPGHHSNGTAMGCLSLLSQQSDPFFNLPLSLAPQLQV